MATDTLIHVRIEARPEGGFYLRDVKTERLVINSVFANVKAARNYSLSRGMVIDAIHRPESIEACCS